MHIIYIVGNRPQFIKLAMLHKKVKNAQDIRESIIHTGQHFSADMSDIFFNELSIDIPVTNLGVHSLSHVALIGRTMEILEKTLSQSDADLVVVFGDTNATLAGALTAKKLKLPLVHIEAGIRTFEESMPEESNRYLTDRMADINFCCTDMGLEHLKNEGFNGYQIKSTVINSGDLMLDAFRYFDIIYAKNLNLVENLQYVEGEYVLATLHRRQNIEDPNTLKEIIEALNIINKQIPVICPIHPNTNQVLKKHAVLCEFLLLPPLGYLSMQQLIRSCKYVITDSGGLQRESFFAQKPTLILMERPFWPELILYGNALNCISKKDVILEHFHLLQTSKKNFDVSVFGDGNAAEIIVNEMTRFYQSLKIKC